MDKFVLLAKSPHFPNMTTLSYIYISRIKNTNGRVAG